MDIAIVGIGNLLMRDEGVGIHALGRLREEFSYSERLEFIDGGTMGLDLLPFIEGRDLVVLIDAVDFRQEPGSVKSIANRDIPRYLTGKLSVHQIALPDLLTTLLLIDNPPRDVVLVGIQPADIGVGIELSPAVSAGMDVLLNEVLSVLRARGVTASLKG